MFTTRANFYHAGTLGLYDLSYDIIFLGELRKNAPSNNNQTCVGCISENYHTLFKLSTTVDHTV